MGSYTGGTGDDSYVGTADPDQASGGDGNDGLIGLGGNDSLDGGTGDDVLNGGDDFDTLIGGTGADDLVGGSSSDRLYSDRDPGPFTSPYSNEPYTPPLLDHGTEVDSLDGGGGDDMLSAGYGDHVSGGADSDSLLISFLAATAGITADFRLAANGGSIIVAGGTISSIEGIQWLEGSNFDDVITDSSAGGGLFGTLLGMGGNDRIIAGYNTGNVYGGEGNDIVDRSASHYNGRSYGEGGDDIIIGGDGLERIDGGDGNDTISGGKDWDWLYGGAGDDTIDGESGLEHIYGEGGNDTIYGGADPDTIEGGDGNDLIYGDWSPTPSEETFFPINNNDTLNGGAGQDVIYGNQGVDRIDGGADADMLYGEAGNDITKGGDGDDLIDLGEGDDTGYGGEGNDVIRSGQGADELNGDAGDDRVYFGATFGVGDKTTGGTGSDQLILQGDYAAGISLTSPGVAQFETVTLLSATDASYQPAQPGSSFSYRLALADAVTAAGVPFAIDASTLTSSESLTVDASAETDARLTIRAGAGDDVVMGGGGNDTLFAGSGRDTMSGGSGQDGIFFGAWLEYSDAVDGGGDIDTLALQGDYSAGVFLSNVMNIEVIALLSGSDTRFGAVSGSSFDYAVIPTDANVAAGQVMTISATGLLEGEDLTFNGFHELDGGFRIFAGRGNDNLTGGGGNDGFFFGSEGNFSADDRIDGLAGVDSIALRGNYSGSGALLLGNATFTNVEVLALLSGQTNEYGGVIVSGGYDYDVTLANGNVAAGQIFNVNGTGLRADESLRFDGRAETDAGFRILSGAGDDILFGGTLADSLYGGLGKDLLQGGPGADTYIYRSAAESTSTGYDAITGFDWNVDRIDVPGATPRGFSQSMQGSLSTASFDADLAAALNAALGANQAALFTANAGTLAGHVFAVIDVNGQVGYQAGQDLVIELVDSILPIDPGAAVII